MYRIKHNYQLLLVLIFQVSIARATMIQVDTTVPDAIRDGSCSLAEAITAANTDTAVDTCPAGDGADIIQLEQTTYTLTAVDNTNMGSNGLPVITTDITIQGIDTRVPGVPQEVTVIKRDPGEVEGGGFSPPFPGEAPVIIRNPAPPMRILHVSEAGTLTLKDLILSNGLLESSIANILPSDVNGGAVLNRGDLTLVRVAALYNSAVKGGAIYSTGQLQISNSRFANNRSFLDGGAIFAGSTVNIDTTDFAENLSGRDGAGLFVNSDTTVSESKFSSNRAGVAPDSDGLDSVPGTAGSGGAVAGNGNLVIQRSDMSDNSATTDGGAIRFSKGNHEVSNLAIYNSLLVANYTNFNQNSERTTADLSVDNQTNLTLLHVALTETGSNVALKIENFPQSDVKSNITLANNILGGINNNVVEGIDHNTCLFNVDQHRLVITNNWVADNSCGTPVSSFLPRIELSGLSSGLQPNSLLIDAADETFCADPMIADMDFLGNPRPVNGDGVDGAKCDIGPYERQAFIALFENEFTTAGFPTDLFFLRKFQINHQQKSLTVRNQFADLGFTSAPGFHGVDPGIVRLSHVFPVFPCTGFGCFPSIEPQPGSKFTLRFQEYNYLDKIHLTEQISYLGANEGIQRRENGEVIIIGGFELSGLGRWKKIMIPPTAGLPHVFLSMQTANGLDAVTVRVRHVTSHSFEAAMFEEESLRHSGHAKEEVAYLIIYSPGESGTVTIENLEVPYLLERIEVNHQWTSVFNRQIRLQEERSVDNEVLHMNETVDALLLGKHLFTQIVTARGMDTVSIRQREGNDL